MLDKLAFAGSQEYELCRELAREIRRRGFDGFVYVSYFAQAHRRRLQNIALFGRPVSEGKVALRSVNRIQLRQASYEFSFGPHNDRSLPMENEEMAELIEQVDQGACSHKEFLDAMTAILERKSEGPR